MSLQSEVHEIDPVTVELEVSVPWDRVQKGLDAGYGKLQKTARVRGFRPGKVPRRVIRQLYGPQVKSEVTQLLIEQGLLEAVQKHEIAVVASPEMDEFPSINEGEALSFKAKLEVRPKLEELSIDGLEVTRVPPAVSDEELGAELDRLREREAEIITPEEERPSRDGDLLTMSYRVEVDGEEKPEMAAEERVVELGQGNLLPEFETALAGVTKGQEVEIRVSYDDEHGNEELRGKTALFRATITELREKQLPALDDEFAKDLGEHETLDALKEATRARLLEAATKRSDSGVREQLIERLAEKNPIPVPPSLITQQEKAMQQELAFFMQISGQPPPPELMAGLRERAERKVRSAILMGELAEREGLKVTDEEIDAKFAAIAEETGKHIAKVRADHAGDKREALENQLLEDKLMAFLRERATVRDAEPTDTDGGADE